MLIEGFLLGLELYHFCSHSIIFFGIRALPRKDLVRSHPYFLVDTGGVLLTTLYCARHLWWLTALQMFQHIGLWYTWDKIPTCTQVITWSSLEAHHMEKSRFHPQLWDSIFGTFFDIACHVVMMLQLMPHCDIYSWMFALTVLTVGARLLIFNPKFAWSVPGQEPAWVKKRLNDKVTY